MESEIKTTWHSSINIYYQKMLKEAVIKCNKAVSQPD